MFVLHHPVAITVSVSYIVGGGGKAHIIMTEYQFFIFTAVPDIFIHNEINWYLHTYS